jgi:hypothetical protein
MDLFESIKTPAPILTWVKRWLVLWFVLLIPWFPFAALAGLAFDGGPTWSAYMFVWAIWTYPITLATAFSFRRKIPFLVFLPMLNVIGFAIGGTQP